MNKMSQTYDFETPFFVTTKGKDVKIDSISIKAPSVESMTPCICLKTELKKAESNNQARIISAVGAEAFDKIATDNKKEVEEEVSDEDKAKQYIETLYSGGADIEKVYNALWRVLKMSGSLFNAEHKATDEFTGAMPTKEAERLLGFYLVNFIIS
jgi:hypothetical protein